MNNLTDKIMIVLCAVATIASVTVLAIVVGSIITSGFSTIRVLGLVATIVSTILMGLMLFVMYKQNRQKQING